MDLARAYRRLGAQLYLRATCPHPFTDDDSLCGLCGQFIPVVGGPVPVEGYEEPSLVNEIVARLEHPENRRVGAEPEIEIEDIGRARDILLRELGLARHEQEDSCRAFDEGVAALMAESAMRDSIARSEFATLVRALPCFMQLETVHRRFVAGKTSQ